MHKKFDHIKIEKKWQQSWKDSTLYTVVERDLSKEKEYVLVELPYSSGNLHIGHWFAFGVVDIYVRTRRMQGKQVLFPIGFDAFGLPAENAAIKKNLDPANWTVSNIESMTKQLESMGNAFSWNHSLCSNNPEYYGWTQWMFTKFFESGLAYKGNGIVNWCPGCNTVIANEQVKSDNTCERSGDTIERREMSQWMIRITAYADRLISDLTKLDYPEHIKESQRQWIGQSHGARFTFSLSSGKSLDIFTTRPETLYGATYLVLAPEHEAIVSNKEIISNWDEVEKYIHETGEYDEITRTSTTRKKTGVQLCGLTALHPATNTPIPIFIADYVLKNYGTGAIMAVPAHDERDYLFAKQFTLPIIEVIKSGNELPYKGDGVLINSGEYTGLDSIESRPDIVQKYDGISTTTYRLRDWSVGRQRYWGTPIPIVYDPQGKAHAIPQKYLPWTLPTDVDHTPTGEPPLARSHELRKRTEEIFGEGWTPEFETMDTFVDSSWYFLRYIDPQNTKVFSSLKAQEDWMPVDTYFGGSEHTTMHLLYSRFWQKALFDLGLVNVDEPYSARINRGLVLGPDNCKMSKSRGNVIDPDEWVQRLGSDTVKMYLAFLGPYAEQINHKWDLGGIAGIRRFLERVFGLHEHITDTDTDQIKNLLHTTISKVTHDINVYKFNTAISALMIFVNHVEKSGLSEDSYKTFLQLLAPFAPHLSEELWSIHNYPNSIHTQNWPHVDPSFLISEMVNMTVQINGKTRGNVLISRDADEDTVLTLLRNNPQFVKKIESEITRVVFVKNKIINILCH